MHLRPATATADDATAIAELYLASRKALLPYAPLAHADDAVRGWICDYLLPAGGVTVAEVAGVISGFIATSHADGCLWIDQLYLQPTAVGQGIGAALLTHALAGMEAPVRLHTFQANHAARRFYERFGFMAIAFGDGSGNEERCPDVLYERRLNQLATS